MTHDTPDNHDEKWTLPCKVHTTYFRNDLKMGRLIHQGYVSKMHMFVRSFCNVVAEGFDLLANVFEEGIARPAPDHHDRVDGHFV